MVLYVVNVTTDSTLYANLPMELIKNNKVKYHELWSHLSRIYSGDVLNHLDAVFTRLFIYRGSEVIAYAYFRENAVYSAIKYTLGLGGEEVELAIKPLAVVFHENLITVYTGTVTKKVKDNRKQVRTLINYEVIEPGKTGLMFFHITNRENFEKLRENLPFIWLGKRKNRGAGKVIIEWESLKETQTNSMIKYLRQLK